MSDPACATNWHEIEYWVFDLDNTLYPASCNLFHQIDARMTAFIEQKFNLPYAQARKLQKDYYVQHGTTLNGLIKEHGFQPEEFLAYVHDIDLSVLTPSPTLANHIKALPGRKFIYTNGSEQHADNVTTALGLSDVFDEIFDIAAAAYTPKPRAHSYQQFVERHEIVPTRAVMFEDIAQNLHHAFALGMTTVLVGSDADWLNDEPDAKRPAGPDEQHAFVDHVTTDLCAFLGTLPVLAAKSL